MSQNPTKKPSATVATDPEGLEREIRRRAYEIYEERGREDGHDLDDWLRAEAEITGTTAETAAGLISQSTYHPITRHRRSSWVSLRYRQCALPIRAEHGPKRRRRRGA